MKIPCEYCGQMIPETAQTCPHCGAANRRVKRVAYGVPMTIEELRAYCQRHNLPLKDMRVFLGEDYRGAKGTKSANLSGGIERALKRSFIYQMVIFGLVMVVLLACRVRGGGFLRNVMVQREGVGERRLGFRLGQQLR